MPHLKQVVLLGPVICSVVHPSIKSHYPAANYPIRNRNRLLSSPNQRDHIKGLIPLRDIEQLNWFVEVTG